MNRKARALLVGLDPAVVDFSRVPFFLSSVLIGIGLWIRLGILETPVFAQLLEEKKIERTPIVEVVRRQPKEIVLSARLRMAEQAPFYIFTAFVFAYGTGTLKMSRDLILSAVLVAACVCSSPYRCRGTSQIGSGAGTCT